MHAGRLLFMNKINATTQTFDYSQTRSFNFGIAQEVGINAALVYDELAFWVGRGKRQDGWIWKSYDEMGERLALTKKQLMPAYTKLEAAGYIETKIMKANGFPTKHFRLLRLVTKEALVSDKKELTGTDGLVTKRNKPYTATITDSNSPTADEVVAFYNEAFSTSYRPVPELMTAIHARLETFTLEEIKTAITVAAKDAWFNGANKNGTPFNIRFLMSQSQRIDAMLNATKMVAVPTRRGRY